MARQKSFPWRIAPSVSLVVVVATVGVVESDNIERGVVVDVMVPTDGDVECSVVVDLLILPGSSLSFGAFAFVMFLRRVLRARVAST